MLNGQFAVSSPILGVHELTHLFSVGGLRLLCFHLKGLSKRDTSFDGVWSCFVLNFRLQDLDLQEDWGFLFIFVGLKTIRISVCFPF